MGIDGTLISCTDQFYRLISKGTERHPKLSYEINMNGIIIL